MGKCIVDITQYMHMYLKLKAIKDINELELENKFLKLFSKKYNTICMDIDKTITSGKNIDNDLICFIIKIIKQNKNICFITGRGREYSRQILNRIFNEATAEGLSIKNITCCTGNGAIYMYSKEGFLDKEEKIVSDEKIKKYQEDKELLRNLYISELRNKKVNNIDEEEIKRVSIESSGKLSLRFPISINEMSEESEMMNILNEVLIKTDLIDEYYSSKSIYKDKTIFEISLANKKMAVEFLADKLEKNEEDIIRIGDQGKRYGNDFQMLNCIQGFSVDEIEPSTLGVLPIIGEYGNRILGINATKKILDDLIIEK